MLARSKNGHGISIVFFLINAPYLVIVIIPIFRIEKGGITEINFISLNVQIF